MFKEGKYKLKTRGVLAASLTVKKIYSDDKVTLFSGRDYTGTAFDCGVGSYPASQGALFGVSGDNAVSSVHVPKGFWVGFCENENKGKGGGKCELFNGKGGNLRNDNAASFVQVGKGTPPKFEEPLKLPKPATKTLPRPLLKPIPTQKPRGN